MSRHRRSRCTRGPQDFIESENCFHERSECKRISAQPSSYDRSECKRIGAQPSSYDRSECKRNSAQPSCHDRMRIMRRSYYVQILAALLIMATILLMWFGYRATSEWQRSTRLVVDRRTVEVLYLMVTALSRDMRAVQSQVLAQLNPSTNDAETYELSDEIAKAFARFPYPDSFFSWTGSIDSNGPLYVFNRADRPPSWHAGRIQSTEFPTTLL